MVNTFLPYPDFEQSAHVLDRQRLGKQRVEVLQIMKALTGATEGYRNHPAAKMWAGYEWALLDYQEAVCHEWAVVRGYKDTCMEKTTAFLVDSGIEPQFLNPEWLGDEQFHASHRSNLLRKDPLWYGEFFDDVPDDLPYIWPVN